MPTRQIEIYISSHPHELCKHSKIVAAAKYLSIPDIDGLDYVRLDMIRLDSIG